MVWTVVSRNICSLCKNIIQIQVVKIPAEAKQNKPKLALGPQFKTPMVGSQLFFFLRHMLFSQQFQNGNSLIDDNFLKEVA